MLSYRYLMLNPKRSQFVLILINDLSAFGMAYPGHRNDDYYYGAWI